MTITLLLDLDDTLLGNPMEVFLPAYMVALSKFTADKIPPDILLPRLMNATWRMLQNQDPGCRLVDVFEAHFYHKLGIEKQELAPLFNRFYEEVFPSLKPLTQPRPAAVRLVEGALERGYQLAIATSPLFPLAANLQRLEWAGLSPSRYPFALISSYDKFHFAKPNPAYLAELLARLGWPGAPVMVGNDPSDDIQCAQQMGIARYWISGEAAGLVNSDGRSAGGGLAGVLEWIESTPIETLMPDYTQPSAIGAILISTPAVLQTLTSEIPAAEWSQRSQPDEWSLTEILCHLRDVEVEVNLPRLEKLISENNPFIPGQDTDKWADERRYIQQDGQSALSRFNYARSTFNNRLSALTPEEWQRPAWHTIFGPTNLNEIVSIHAGHDRLHIQQILANVSQT